MHSLDQLRLSVRRDSFKYGYPLHFSEDSYPPRLDPSDSSSQAVGALAAIGACLYSRALEASRNRDTLMSLSDRIALAIDRFVMYR